MNLVFWEERTGTEATKRFAYAPTVVKHVVKKISEFRVVRKWWENARFCPENAKNKAENDSFSALFGASVHNRLTKRRSDIFLSCLFCLKVR